MIKDIYIRYGLLIVGAFGAYNLVSNITNVMGVFIGAVNLPTIILFIFKLDSTQQLFFIGGVAISIGIYTYSRHVMKTVGKTLMPLTSEAAIVLVLSQVLVSFILSSQGLSNAFHAIGWPSIPLASVLSSQVIIGSIIGIGLYKCGKQIQYNIFGHISLGWIARPLAAGVFAFFMLFSVNNAFSHNLGGDKALVSSIEIVSTDTIAVSGTENFILKEKAVPNSESKKNIQEAVFVKNENAFIESLKNNYLLIFIWASASFISFLILLFFSLKKTKIKNLKTLEIKAVEKKYSTKIESLKKSLEEELHLQDDLGKELKFRQSEMVTMAMSIIHKNEFLNKLKVEVVKIKSGVRDQDTRAGLNKLSLMIVQDLSIDRDREKFQMHINSQNSSFIHRLTEAFPTMTDHEKRLASLLRLNLSSKEIASILNISPKSVEMNRYRLRKKLQVDPKVSLSDLIRDF